MVKSKKISVDYHSAALHFLPETLSKHEVVVEEFAATLKSKIQDRIKTSESFPNAASAISDGIYATIMQYIYSGVSNDGRTDEIVLDAIDADDFTEKLIDDIKRTMPKKPPAKKKAIPKKKAKKVVKTAKKKTVAKKK